MIWNEAIVASYADAIWARHAIFLPHERPLKPREHSLPFVQKDQPESTWRSPESQSALDYCSIESQSKAVIEQPPSSHVSYYLWKTDSDQILLLHVWRTLRKKSSETTVCYATFLYTSGENNGSVDITHCVVEIDLSVFSSSNPFVCIRCYKRLLRFEKAKTNLPYLQEEIKEDFKKGANSKFR